MIKIPVLLMEFVEGGRAIWIHNKQGSTVLRIQCTGAVRLHKGCTNISPHADINVVGNIEVCVPSEKPPTQRRKRVEKV
jgi:hypothetical protein